ncbi:MAG: hypothetical protein M5U22_23010 [Thermoleophilia bacterium]|nr:hypothetical protein [Thermoleophilia bacterium]
MADTFTCSWPELDITVRLEPLGDNKELFDWFVGNLPTSAVQSHAVVSGELTYVLNLPLKNPLTLQYEDFVKHDLMESDVGYAWTFATFGNVGSLMLKYGHMTEPMAYPGFARVVEEDLPLLRQAGEEIWDAIYNTKRIITVFVDK